MATTPTAFGNLPLLLYPGRVIKVGDAQSTLVKQIQQRINALGCGPIPVNGNFEKTRMLPAVKLFQARFPDATGAPLVVDGQIGSLTWGALFGPASVVSNSVAPTVLTTEAVAFATTQIGVMENPLGSNRGPQVDLYLKAAGLNPANGSYPWCVAFTYYCYQQAAKNLNVPNPHIRTAGVLDHWNKAGQAASAVRITKARAVADPSLVQPGSLFIMDFGAGLGHSGIVVQVADGRLVTIEGNTNDNGSRNGIGVFRRTARKIADINKGFVEYR